MFSLDEAFFANSSYFVQTDLYAKILFSACGSFFVVEFIRAQVAEIEVLQLVPGLYLLLLFLSWVFLIAVSIAIERLPMAIDNKKSSGTKTINRLEIGILVKDSIQGAMNQLVITLSTSIPIGFEAFNSYGERTLEDLWSLDEVVALEVYLLLVIILLSQIPTLVCLNYNTEKFILGLPFGWRIIGVSCFTIGGMVTPTIDAVTQISFAASTYYLYLLVIGVLIKRRNVKSKEATSLN